MSEPVFHGVLALAGGVLLLPLRGHVGHVLGALLAYPVGQIVWVTSAFALALSGVGFTPGRATALLAVTALAALSLGVARRTVSGAALLVIGTTGALVAAAAVALVALNPSAMTNDSFIMLTVAQAVLHGRGFEAPAELLLLRSFPIYPVLLQGAAHPPGETYLLAAAPLFNVAGLSALAYALRQELRRWVAVPWDVLVPVLFFVVLASTYHVAFASVYVRGNLEYGICVALYAAFTWRGTVRGGGGAWWLIGLLFLVGATLLRVESPFYLLPFLALQAVADRVPRGPRTAVVLTYATVVTSFYGTVVLTRGEGIVLDGLSLALLLGGTVAVAVLAVATGARPGLARRLEPRMPTVLVAVMTVAAVGLTLANPGQMLRSLGNVVATMVSPTIGLWGVTWSGVAALLALCARGPRLPAGGFFWAPLASGALFVYALSFFTPFDLRWSTSPNRLLPAILVPALYAMVLRACARPLSSPAVADDAEATRC